MGADRTTCSGKEGRPRTHSDRQPAFHGRDPLAGKDGVAVAGSAARAWQLADRALPVPALDAFRGLGSLFKALSATPDFEYVLVDATICKTHADASGAKGGLKLTQLAAPRVV